MAVPEHWMFSGFNETPDERIGWLEQEVIKARAEANRHAAEVKRLREDNEGLRQFAEWCARIEGWRFQQVVDYAKRTLDA